MANQDDLEMVELFGPWNMDWSLPGHGRIPKIAMLSLIDTAVTDFGMKRLRNAVNLTEFCMRSILISDHSMPILCGLNELQSLLFSYAPRITDKGIASLRTRQNLGELYLSGTRATDHAIDSILHLQDLGSIDLSNTRITDSGIANLAELSTLKLMVFRRNKIHGHTLRSLPNKHRLSLYLEKCPIKDDAVISAAEHLSNLKTLSLNDTLVTDKCLPALSKLPNLETLWLDETPVTDAGIMNLKGHPVLAVLYLRKTPVSEAAIQKLKDASPQKLRIYNK